MINQSYAFLQGDLPYFVNATAGTTVLGSYDPLEPIADICEKYGLWFHVDVSRDNVLYISFNDGMIPF